MKKTFKSTRCVCDLLLKPDLKMKLTYLFFTVFLFQGFAGTHGQNTKVSLDLDNVTIEKVFDQIEQLTDYKFLYSLKSVNLNRRISLSTDKESLKSVLQRLFKSTDVTFKILERQIVLKVNPNITNNQIQQTVSGKVTDENQLPLPGVTILIAGTQKGVITDFDGSYNIEAINGDILVFNYLGYLDVEIVVGENTSYNVEMSPTTLDLDTVNIVYTGYQEIKKERVTGSFGKIEETVLENKIDQNILSKIANETPGLLLDSNEGFLVRGINSIDGQRTPLIVVDGIALPDGSSVSDINPNDVQSINVLKDAAASSIWGIKSGSGVIVIVTKKGSRNSRTTVETSINSSFIPKLDIFDTKIGSSSTQLNYQLAHYNARNTGIGVQDIFSGPTAAIDARQFGQLNPVMETLFMEEKGDITAGEANARLNALSLLDSRQEYSDKVLRPTIWNQYNLSVSGGGENQDFRASVTFNNNESGLVNVDSKQIIANLRSSLDLSDKLNLSFITNFSQSLANNGPTQLNDNLNPLFSQPTSPFDFLSTIPINSRLLDESGNYVAQVGGANQGFSDFLRSRGVPYDYTYNILQEVDNANNRLDNVSLRLQAALNYKFFEGLDLALTYRYQLDARETKNLFNENTFSTRNIVNLFAQVNRETNRVDEPETDYLIDRGSILDNTFFKSASHTLRGQLNFDKSFNDDLHQITAIAGYEVGITNFETDSRRLYGYDDSSLNFDNTINYGESLPNFYERGLSFGGNIRVPLGSSVFANQDRIFSYYGNVSYTYKSKYTLSGSTRLDDTDFFGASENFRNKPLYSLGFSWDVRKDLFPSSKALNFLYMRASYGTNANTGNKEAGKFLTIRPNNGGSGVFDNRFASVDNIPNNLLQLEKVSKTNLGLDFGLFRSFITGSIDFYSEQSENLFSDVAFNPTLGVSTQNINAGELTNKGFDLELNLDFSKPKKDFSYKTTMNFSLNKNKLTKVEFRTDAIISHLSGTVTRLGKPLSTIYSYRYAGLDTTGEPQYFRTDGSLVDFDANEDITSVNDLKEEGTLVPVYYGSWINNFSYKNFSLRILTSLKAGHVFRYNNRYTAGQYGIISSNVTNDFNNRWQQPGDENRTSIPAVATFSTSGTNQYTFYSNIDEFVDDASHIRLNQINLGYNLPKSIIRKIGAKSIRMSIQADNIAVWSFNKWDVDPENQFFPLQKTFSFNINTRF